MYYLVKKSKESEFEVIEIEKANDSTYRKLQKEVTELKGQFGRKVYAQAWANYWNKKITRDELMVTLNTI